jgi:heat-inducible transcriptional repressor
VTELKSVKKQDLILDAIIRAYLENNLPIGSGELQAKMPIEISASTIRSYFQRLSSDGILMQLHISGGRIPTKKALQRYWIEKLVFDNILNLKNLATLRESVKNFGLFCVLEFNDKEVLREIINVKERFILLVFDNYEISIAFSSEAILFLSSLINVDVYSLRALAKKVGFDELRVKLDKMLIGNILFKEGEEIVHGMVRDSNNNFLYSFYKDESSILELKEGVYFDDIVDDGYMVVKQKAKIENTDTKLLCLGRLNVDFESFFNRVKE